MDIPMPRGHEIMWPVRDQPTSYCLPMTPHWLALTTPDPTPWTSLYGIEYPHETPSWNAPQWPQATWPLLKIMWASRDDHVTTCHCIGRSLIQRPWDLRVPTLFFFDLFLSYGVLMLFWLLRSAHMCTCSRSRLGGHLYASLCPVHIPVFFTPMQTAPLLQIPSGLHPDSVHVAETL